MELTDTQKQYFMDMELLFNQPGWARLTSGWKQEQAQLPEAAFFAEDDDKQAMRERYALLDELIKLPEYVERQKISILNTPEDETDV